MWINSDFELPLVRDAHSVDFVKTVGDQLHEIALIALIALTILRCQGNLD
ncbi:hypothetical protein H1P_2140013 [Hyella patelloides LEGE 07179]|uniref:Uncharacterized protein n=1 Tax=Hyella patelloides LEGE 07179 TaxID=945734 RepID=A0A563VR32_9CYAN|nr:hypothetical protein H1P_2140013 [Hyella patelloides LEGE 07179]